MQRGANGALSDSEIRRSPTGDPFARVRGVYGAGRPRRARRLADIPAGCGEILNRPIDVAPSHLAGRVVGEVCRVEWRSADTSRPLLVWGGGHSDYAGNEVYAFDLTTLAWQRLTDPSVADRARTPLYPDGQPRARHTYNYIEYVPSRDRLVVFGASGPYPAGGGEFSRDLIEFDPSTNRWTTQGRSAIPMPGNMIGHRRDRWKTGRCFYRHPRAALRLMTRCVDAGGADACTRACNRSHRPCTTRVLRHRKRRVCVSPDAALEPGPPGAA